jgi:GT2 family glycosyltransferase
MTSVSVVVPTRNRSALLATTLRSILWQRAVGFEVIVVDDGSREDMVGVVPELTDPRVRVIRHDTPRGVSRARNHGAAEASAQWLAFCDDDDLWAPDKLTCLLAAARAERRRWAYSGAVHVNRALDLLSAKLPPPPDRLVATLPRWNVMPGGSSNVIVEADAFRAVGGWDHTLVNLADWDLWARLAQREMPACVCRPLVGYRIHDGNASGDTALILKEARVIDGRYGARLDYGELHHYLAWVHLRVGRRRAALPHLAQAALRGQLAAVMRTLSGVAARHFGRWWPTPRRSMGLPHADWMAEAEAWVAPLREYASPV